MLGKRLSDPENAESGGTAEGLGLLPCDTVFTREKTRVRRKAHCLAAPFAGAAIDGYEIHMGDTETDAEPFSRREDGSVDGAVRGAVFGSYLHGLFDSGELTERMVRYLAERKGVSVPAVKPEPWASYRNRQYDFLADAVRKHLDLDTVRRIMEEYAK